MRMRRRLRVAGAVSVAAVLAAGCNNSGNGDSTQPNDVSPGPTKGPSVSISPGPRTTGPTSGLARYGGSVLPIG